MERTLAYWRHEVIEEKPFIAEKVASSFLNMRLVLYCVKTFNYFGRDNIKINVHLRL